MALETQKVAFKCKYMGFKMPILAFKCQRGILVLWNGPKEFWKLGLVKFHNLKVKQKSFTILLSRNVLIQIQFLGPLDKWGSE